MMRVYLLFLLMLIDAVYATDFCAGTANDAVSQGCANVESGANYTIGDMALCFISIFCPFTQVVIGGAYVGGILMFTSAVFKFKQYKDNSTQIPIGTAFALFAISVLLVFLPGLYSQTGQTIFGEDASSAGIFGTDLFNFSSSSSGSDLSQAN